MKPLYELDRRRMRSIEGVVYPLETLEEVPSLDIFAVPEKNAVGTNSLDNALTLLRFGERDLTRDVVRKDFLKYVSGGKMVFLDAPIGERIGYSQTRGFLLFDVKAKTFVDHLICRHLEMTIDDVVTVDPERLLFMFQLNYMLGLGEKAKVLALFDLSGEEPRELASYDLEDPTVAARLAKTTLSLGEEGGKRRLRVLDEHLRRVNHPLCAVYDRQLETKDLGLPYLHPTLPFALWIEEDDAWPPGDVLWLASWRRPDEPELYEMAEGRSFGTIRFSPDGKWLVFEDGTVSPRQYVVMPVEPSLPHYVGAPVHLRCERDVPESWNGRCAWIAESLGIVCCAAGSCDRLIRWDIR